MNAGRDARGRWRKGASGNPGGRPAGLRGELKARLADEVPTLVDRVVELAKGGDLEALRLALAYGIGRPPMAERYVSADFALGAPDSPEAVAEARRRLVQAVAAGEIGLDESEALSKILDRLGADQMLVALRALDRRLEAAKAEAQERGEAMADLRRAIKKRWGESDQHRHGVGYSDERPTE
jgi:hypothetical protein